MRKYIILDISGKVLLYDNALCNAISVFDINANTTLLTPGKGLLCLVPEKFKNSENIAKRLVKVIEGLINYVHLIVLCTFSRPDVLHFQWLPFLEFVCWEIFIIRIIKILSPKTKLILTIHNIYPHNISVHKKIEYNKRFSKISVLFKEFIVHTQISKNDVVREFNLSPAHVNVCYHGVFEPRNVTLNKAYRKNGILNILQFGGHSLYKGTDILVDAVCSLDDERKSKIKTRIVGNVSQDFLRILHQKDSNSIISFSPFYLEDSELNKEINNADIIVLPYRSISQSGVLLLSIYFEKLIICSNLPSFVETMRSDDDNSLDNLLFFNSEDVGSLKELLEKYIDGKIDEKVIRDRVIKLKVLYSWSSAAKATLEVYTK